MADLSGCQKRQRLFIGGLHESVTEEDISKRFNVYGSVLSVQKIIRAPSDVFPGKTFAFLDIDISERDLQRCCSVYSKAKWKGGTISIQVARESFLVRRERECREARVEDEDQKNATRLSSLVKGGTDEGSCKTKATGKWSKGAGGQVPPVVQLHAGSSRVKKPSHHRHQVKQLSSTDCADTPVASLTWALDCEGSTKEGDSNSEGSTKEGDSNSEGSAGEDDSNSEGSAGDDESNSEGSAGDDDSNSEGSAGDDDPNSEGSAGEDDSNSERSAGEDDSNSDGSAGDDEPQSVDKGRSPRLKAHSLPTELPLITCTPVTHARDDRNAAPILGALYEQSLPHSVNKMNLDVPTVDCHEEDNPLPLSTCKVLATQPHDSNLLPIMEALKSHSSTHDLNREADGGSAVSSKASRKKRQSEEQRQKALEEMAKRAVRNRLSHVGVGPQAKTRRIVFSSSDGEPSGEDDVEATAVDKDTGARGLDPTLSDHHVRMTLFDSSDSEGNKEGEEDLADELIGVKPQFEGKRGARLFKLQRKFGRDKRFQLDERFLSDADSDVELQKEAGNPPEEEEGDASLSKQIQEEKVIQNSIIDQILGFQSVGTGPQSGMSMAQMSLKDFQLKRYDPTAEDHEVMEFNENSDTSEDDSGSESDSVGGNSGSSNSSGSDREADKMDAQAEELKDKYYSIQGDLKNAFHQTGGDGSSAAVDGFSFAALFDSSGALDQLTSSVADRRGEGEVEGAIGRKPKGSWWLNSAADSSSGEECNSGDDGTTTSVQGENEPEVSGLFFFHSHSDRLCNRLDSIKGEGAFKRQKPLEELEQGWPQLRAMYKQSYKQRRRDALRWLKKRKDSKSQRN